MENLAAFARERIMPNLIKNGFTSTDVQVMCLSEEAGEVVKAYRRGTGRARTPGPIEDVFEEVADVVITAYVLAEYMGFDLDAAIDIKLDKVMTRGWKNER